MLLQPGEDRTEDAGTYISRSAAQHWAEVQAAAAHQHRAPRLADRIRSLFRGHGEVPSGPAEGDGSDEEGEFTGIVNSYRPEPLPFRTPVLNRPQPAPEVAHENYDPERTQAVSPVDLADDLPADEPPSVRPYAPPEARAIPWGTWDTDPGPLLPQPVLALAADLTELPDFREAMSRSTRNQASQCLCGDGIAGQTWGERMMREGIHMLSVWDLPVVRMLDALPPAAIEARQERAA
jgi:hypothetical protein